MPPTGCRVSSPFSLTSVATLFSFITLAAMCLWFTMDSAVIWHPFSFCLWQNRSWESSIQTPKTGILINSADFFVPRHMSLSRLWNGLPGVGAPPIRQSEMVMGANRVSNTAATQAFPQSPEQAVPRQVQQRLLVTQALHQAVPGMLGQARPGTHCCYIFKNSGNHLFICRQFEAGHRGVWTPQTWADATN